MDNDELLTLCKNEIRQSVGYIGGELSEQRRLAMEYYYGQKFGNEVEGRSQYVSRDVSDTVEWIMPSLMRIFASGDQIVRFEPHGPEDEPVAKQATDYVNYIFTRQNNGFHCLHSFFKDALLQKNGFIKAWWDKTEARKEETYTGLAEDQILMLLQNPDTELKAHTDNGDGTHDVTVSVRKRKAGVCIEPVPPEEFLVNSYACYPLSKNRFVAHRKRVTVSELKEMGYDDLDDVASDEDGNWNTERIARFGYDDTDFPENQGDESQREVWLDECYVLVDFDGDGIAERRKVLIAGRKVLENEEWTGLLPFATCTPTPVPHKLFGLSIADAVSDIQLLKSTIFRSILDNAYLTNNNRWMALDGMVNIDDLLSSRPGGIIRVKTFDAVRPMPTNLLGAPMFNLLEYADTVKENRTGVTRYNQGIDANSLNKTATGISQIMSASQQRVELIARVFAETGVKDLFNIILELVTKYQDQPEMVRLNNEWVPMDPRQWADKYDVTVMVGLGTGSREVQMAGVQQVLNLQLTALQAGLPIVTPQNIYASAMELTKANSMRGGEMFFTSPDQIPPAPPQQDPAVMQAQAQMQMEQQKFQSQMQMEQQKSQAEIMKELMKLRGEKELKTMELQGKFALEAGNRGLSERELGLKEAQFSRQSEREDEAHMTEQQSRQAELDINMALKTLADTVVASQQAAVQSQEALVEVMKGQERVAEALTEAAKAIGAPRKLIKAPDGSKMSVPIIGNA